MSSTTTAKRPQRKVYIVGVGMTKFEKPGRRDDFDYPAMATEAATKALIDANVTYDAVEQAFVGYCYGDSTSGQRALYPLGLTTIPIVNVNNNCSTGSSALYMARNAIAGGLVDCALALGFEKMARGSLSSTWSDRTNPLEEHVTAISARQALDGRAPMAAQIFGLAGVEYCTRTMGMHDPAAQRELMARIAHKNHRHSTLNPYSQFRDAYTLEQIVASRPVFGPLTMLQCCPTSDGSACAVLASEEFVRRHHLMAQAVEVAAMVMRTDGSAAFPGMFDGDGAALAEADPARVSFVEVAGAGMTRRAAEQAYAEAGIGPADVQVVELHDCFSANELITYDALGLCPRGKHAGDLVLSGCTTHAPPGTSFEGRRYVVNPSGGLISKGHPLGATGLAQCAELTWQLRGWCGERQVADVQHALQHNIGLGGAVVISVLKRGEAAGDKTAAWQDPRERFGYNPAVEARGITPDMLRQVRSKTTTTTTMTARL